MAFENLISISFSEAELTALDKALSDIATVLSGKTINLSPDERRQYGSIAEQNKLFVNKAKNLMEQNPSLIPGFLDKAEFDRDYAARQQIEDRLLVLKGLVEQLEDTKVALDHDNYFNALSFYRNIRFFSKENVPGTTVLHQQLKQFFPRTNSQNTGGEE